VVVYPNRERDPSHELGSYEHVARGLADILGGTSAVFSVRARHLRVGPTWYPAPRS